MAWIARDLDGDLFKYENKPIGMNKKGEWIPSEEGSLCMIDSDADEKLIGRHLAWEDGPVEI